MHEALLGGESPAALMERQPDDEGRAVIGDILSISTELDDEGLMHMAQDCLKKLRRERETIELPKSQANTQEARQQEELRQAYLLAEEWKKLK